MLKVGWLRNCNLFLNISTVFKYTFTIITYFVKTAFCFYTHISVKVKVFVLPFLCILLDGMLQAPLISKVI